SAASPAALSGRPALARSVGARSPTPFSALQGWFAPGPARLVGCERKRTRQLLQDNCQRRPIIPAASGLMPSYRVGKDTNRACFAELTACLDCAPKDGR